MSHYEFDPLSYPSLTKSCIRELMDQELSKLSIDKPFEGAGIYAIFYNGDHPLYQSIRGAETPIYVGKAVLPGTRKGRAVAKKSTRSLYLRLNEHKKSIKEAENLELSDFSCKYLAVKDAWVTLSERLLIEHFNPAWNSLIDGFGNHAPGKGRLKGQKSWWDVVHPGRSWSKQLLDPTDQEKEEFINFLKSELAQ